MLEKNVKRLTFAAGAVLQQVVLELARGNLAVCVCMWMCMTSWSLEVVSLAVIKKVSSC